MAVTKAKKDEILKDLDERFAKATAAYFADFSGLSVKDMGLLRGKLREEGIQYRVAKKTLMRLSLKNNKLPEAPAEVLEGPVGVAFGEEDVIMAVKLLHNFSKENDNLKILGGLVEGKFITQAEALELAKLPSREELLAKLVGSMKAPVSGFYGVTSGLLRGLVQVLKAVGEAKPAEETPAEETPAEETPAEETPAEEAPAEETPAEETPAEEAPAEETPAEETPAKEAPAEEAPAEEATAEETPAEDAPAEDAPAKDAPDETST